MIQAGQAAHRNQAWLLIAPSVAVALITLAFTFVSDGPRDALDPREQMSRLGRATPVGARTRRHGTPHPAAA